MRILGMPVPFTGERRKALTSISDNRGWFPLIREPFAGAWQRNIRIDAAQVQAFHAVFACQTLIASDIAKLRVRLVQQDANGVWNEITSPAYTPVLRRPNAFQNRIQFWESYILSKLTRGNVYVLKQRDARNVVTGLFVLDPNRVQPAVSESGDVFYRLNSDHLSGIQSAVIAPAREIIHDRCNCLFHPLVGIPPLFAAGRAAQQGLNIQANSIRLFENNSAPGGVLTAPGEIREATAKRLKEQWEANFAGENLGRVAVLGDGLKYEKMSLTAVEGQLIEQLKWTAETVCSAFHVPPYKIGVGALPSYNNIQALNVEYYSQCLQSLIEAAELCLDEGLEMPSGYGSEFDLDGLLRMDSIAQIDVLQRAVGASILSPNEARKKMDYPPVRGGEAPLSQQQYYSLEALAKRDAQADPFAPSSPPPPADNPPQSPTPSADAVKAMFRGLVAIKQLEHRLKYNPNHDPQTGQFSDGGGAGGTESDPVHRTKFEFTKPRVQRAIDEVTHGEGFPADQISVSAERKFFTLGGEKKEAGGHYDSETRKITMFPAAWSGAEHSEIRGALAHEIMHSKTDKVLSDEGAEGPIAKLMADPRLARDDGVTEYSKQWWAEPKADAEHKVHETLAEISRLKWTDANYRKKISGRWLNLYDAVNKSYKP